MTTIDLSTLATITGGASQAQNVCNRSQYDWMLGHMVSDSSMKPGVQRHVVLQDSRTCGFPFPKGK